MRRGCIYTNDGIVCLLGMQIEKLGIDGVSILSEEGELEIQRLWKTALYHRC
jgi:hypothetical protein